MNNNNWPAASTGDTAFSTVDASKLQPPRSTGNLIAREQLRTRLLAARQQRCVVLRGPAGCGKTSTLLAWRQQLLPLGYDFAWLTLTQEDNELARFLDYLIASIARVGDSMAREASQLEGRGVDAEAVERTIITLVRGIASHRRELVLVLDDLHSLTDLGIHEALQWLLDYAPPNLHLVLASRSVVPLSLARLRSQAMTLELDFRDLRFSLEESERFLQTQLGAISHTEARQLYEQTDGWVAGLQLLCVGRKRPRQSPASPAQLRDTQAFEAFFGNNVLAQLMPGEVDQLVHMAVCNRFCAALCAALNGQPQALGDANILLTRLESDNLFMIPVEGYGPERWFRFHPLLREILLKRFATRSEEEQGIVHARAWNWFREHGQLDEAVRHAVLGGQGAAAARLVETQAERLYAHGDLRLLVNLVRRLPVRQVELSPALSILMARLHIFAQDFAAAEALIERLWHSVPLSDGSARFRLVLLRATLAVQRDDIDSALSVLPQMLHPPKEANAVMVGGGINICSWLYMHQGQYELARRIQMERPHLIVDGAPLIGTAGGSLQGRCLIGLSLAMQGQITQAERVYREVLQEAEQGGKSCADAYYLAGALLGQVLYETNEVQAAFELLSGWLDILERISIPDSVLRVFGILASAQWALGHHQEAFAYLERLHEYGRKLGLDRLIAYSLVWRVHWHLLLGEQVATENCMAQLAAVYARHPQVENSPLSEIHMLAQHAEARLQAARGDLKGASLRLGQLLTWCENHGRHGLAVRIMIFGAFIDRRLGQEQAARDKVIEALRRGHRFGLIRSLIDAHPDALDMIIELVAQEPLDPVLAFYVERLVATRPVPSVEAETALEQAPRQAAGQGIECLSEREIEVMRLLAQALPNKKIARALGLSPETVKWHLSHIYSKLAVSSRDEAVARMRDHESASGAG